MRNKPLIEKEIPVELNHEAEGADRFALTMAKQQFVPKLALDFHDPISAHRPCTYCHVDKLRVPRRRKHSLEDTTDFLSYAANASRDLPEYNCRGLVVAGHAGDAGACADRSGGETGLR